MSDDSDGFRARMVRRMAGPEGISATQLSDEVGASQPTLSRWLRETGNLVGVGNRGGNGTGVGVGGGNGTGSGSGGGIGTGTGIGSGKGIGSGACRGSTDSLDSLKAAENPRPRARPLFLPLA